jgi:coenzyme F420-reducing hydrogenase delta subunit
MAAALRNDIVAVGKQDESPHIIVFACRDDQRLREAEKAGLSIVTVNCMGQLPPSYVDFTLSRGHADGILLLGCQDGNCSYRFGAEWTEQRLARQRDPMVRSRVDMSRVAIGWQAPWSENPSVVKKYEAFRRSLQQ